MEVKVKSFLESFNYALEGIVHTFRTQRNMKVHFGLAFLVLLFSLFLNISRLELIALFFSITFVIAMEMINTSIEIVVDMICKEYNYRARIAKNIAAGAVFMAAMNAVIVGYFVFVDKLRNLSLDLVHIIRQEPFYLTFINLGLLLILIVFLKASVRRGTPLKGGMPSGHSAIAFAVATIIIFITVNFLVATMVLVLALLVGQSRLEAGTHSLVEVVIGALLGIVLTLIVFQLL